MRKLINTLLLVCSFILFGANLKAEVKNVILMIPDGTSSDILTIARWVNHNKPLALDSIICGLVKTHTIDNRITDSAPAGTALATGSKSMAGYIGMDSAKRELKSVLALAQEKGMSAGLVFTCQFPHATPASFVCNHSNRNAYQELTRQFIERSPDIIIGGGKQYINSDSSLQKIRKNGIKLIDNYPDFIKFDFQKGGKNPVWALFADDFGCENAMSYNCDRDETKEPGLAEMTKKALEYLSSSGKGFFLMVEGSQVDWAAHDNDPKAIIADFLEFDRAVGTAIDFANKSKNTIVIVCPDHGNGGISIGRKNTDNNTIKYDKLNYDRDMAEPLRQAKRSARWVVDSLKRIVPEKNYFKNVGNLIKNEYNVSLNENELLETIQLLSLYHFAENKQHCEESKILEPILKMIANKLSEKSYIGWTSIGHTGEDVFLAVYPKSLDMPMGVIDNTDVAKYIARILKLGKLPIYRD